MIVAIISFIAGSIWTNRKRARIFFQSVIKRNKEIRISCAYLFRIKSEEKHLLIKGNRISQYQPVGGVYKYYDSFKLLKEKLEITDEQEPTFYEDNDLRVRTKGKYILKFLEFFVSQINIDTQVEKDWRSYLEERRKEDLAQIIEEESLKADNARKFVEIAFRDGVLRTTGTDFDGILPPISRFGGSGRGKRKEGIIAKLMRFFEKYFGLL